MAWSTALVCIAGIVAVTEIILKILDQEKEKYG